LREEGGEEGGGDVENIGTAEEVII